VSRIFGETDIRRVGVILLLGAIAVIALVGYKMFRLPGAAPADIQTSGYKIIRSELEVISNSDFGRSERGKMLVSEIRRQLDVNRIVFSSDLKGPRGLTVSPILFSRRIYIKVLEMNHGKYIHQLPWQLSEALFHEAVHSLNSGYHGNSIEEECDAFMAGVTVEAISRGEPPATILTMDGMPVGEFVKQSYRKIPRNPDYKPIGITLQSLKEHTALD